MRKKSSRTYLSRMVATGQWSVMRVKRPGAEQLECVVAVIDEQHTMATGRDGDAEQVAPRSCRVDLH